MSTTTQRPREASVAFVSPPSRVDYAAGIDAVLSAVLPNTRLRTHHFDARGTLPDPNQFDVVVVTGSYVRVADRDPWAVHLQQYVRKRVDSDRPLLGVCFGHQFLADSLGGEVERLPTGAAGYRTVSLTDGGRAHPAFVDVPDTFDTFLWHVDHVTRLPDEAIVLARADDTIQAFALADHPVMGIQFHPEVTPVIARKLVEGADEASPPSDDVCETLTDERATSVRTSRRVYRDFLRDALDASADITHSQTRK
ncbi:type 1 glutamine amidotransferase [Haloferax sp. MBLA0076]|uniref:Type 1 glutamine amidotransferase n=1 Tax=Haloferax litoreum TaxID=2666140 RepID=A0A6A8GLH8_9EURY|nr:MULTISPECIES: type 1 glutamine amidotransferase [Haloferax]KAB1189912.1 type 1 glutamine amidotransferase [Haloferax sp. CBA1148]MRX23681.1 type 1 glutamine amidotransferase [Haloferax litoreum]